MAKQQQHQVPAAMPVIARRQAIIRLMEQAGPLCGLSARSAFERWLQLIESDICCPIAGCGRLTPERMCDVAHACQEVRRQRWERCAVGLDHAMPLFTEALAHLFVHYRDHFEDLLGPIFEELGLGGRGVFFTPWNVARMMAAMSAGDLRGLKDRERITINDPACGSGVMLLAFLEHIAEQRPDLYDKICPTGQDINEDCVRMCRISLRLVAINRAERLVAAYEQGDLSAALKMQTRPDTVKDLAPDGDGER